ncbi:MULTISPECIES: RHS repeat domain-containing protein [Niastella]|uniref:RHS repeat-associated core domain-containing protein n=1 Tax=Niastella soli TaxID=2821487 RepID=A0ABS3Z529_9BACT|nr:RHS repeat-associated core domain-containing protein [Niastella soli]MBO9205249.1 hypothetical protein [Niastella soli]
MAGDAINIFAISYHRKPVAGYTSSVNGAIVSKIINGFAATSLISGKGITGSQITGQPGFPTSLGQLIGNQPDQSSKAGINWIILDEQFKWVGGGFDMVGAAVNPDGTFKTHDNSTIPTINIPKNGYIYVYCSNESQYDVFFDNLQVIHSKGPLLEETHYYPFGLTMVGISSKALNFGEPENKKKFNGIEKEDGLVIEIYDAQLRELDPQLGRWWEIDPKVENMENWSPYASNYDNPIRYSDPLGDVGQSCCEGLVNWLSDRWEAEKRGVWLVGKALSNAVDQALENAKDNWNAGNDPIHKFAADPLAAVTGPVGPELNAAENIIGAEVRATASEANAAIVRKLLPDIKWHESYIEYKNNQSIEKKFKENKTFNMIWEITESYFKNSADSEYIIKIAGRSAEFHVINKLLIDAPNTKIEGISLTKTVIAR